MKYKTFLIKYGEIGVKGKNRYKFEDALIKQINHTLKRVSGKFDVIKEHGRIYVNVIEEADDDEVIEALTCVFGIVGICPVVRFADKELSHIKTMCVQYMSEAYPSGGTFKVDTRRIDKSYPGTSETINADIGEAILEGCTGFRVDVHEPQIRLHIEIRDEVNIYSKEIKGPGGMPIGTNGSAMLLLSGGIDSPVAGYMIAKRGVRIEATYFHAPPYTSERAKMKVVDLARLVAKYTGPINLHVVNFTDIQLMIYELCPHEELTIIMRRYMMLIAQSIAQANDDLALITGESIGQVASQTVQSLVATNAICDMPVFRPLIGFDKQEIVELAERIGTYETSIQPYEDCCTIFVAKHPVTKPQLDRIEKSEKLLVGKIEPLVQQAIDSSERILCTYQG